MDLKNKSTERIITHFNGSQGCFPASWNGCDTNESIEHFLHTKIIHGTAEKYGCHFSCEIIIYRQLSMHAFDQFCIFTQMCGITFSYFCIKDNIIQIIDSDRIFFFRFGACRKQTQTFIIEIINAFKIFTAVDGPCHRV